MSDRLQGNRMYKRFGYIIYEYVLEYNIYHIECSIRGSRAKYS